MDYQKLENFVSKQRLDRYLVSCGNSKDKAADLYMANILVAKTFYPVLSLFEIFLRNSINDNLSAHFSDPAWIIHQKSGFMRDASLGPKFGMQKQVLKAETNIRGTITPGKIVAEQTLGFWTSFFENRHYKLISGSVIRCFPNKPPVINRSDITNMLTDIREFRNRVYHNENICFNNITVDFSHAEQIKSKIYSLADWMDTDLKNYILRFDTVDTAIADALCILI